MVACCRLPYLILELRAEVGIGAVFFALVVAYLDPPSRHIVHGRKTRAKIGADFKFTMVARK